MFNNFLYLLFSLVFITYLRYFEVININIFIFFILFSFLLVSINKEDLTINNRTLYFLFFMIFIIIQTIFLSEKYNSLLLYISAISCLWLFELITRYTNFNNIIKVSILLFICHIALALLQIITKEDIFFISKSFGFFGNDGDGQILTHRVPGLSFISGDFYASICLALSYLMIQRFKLFVLAVLFILFVNLSKVFIPSILVLLVYHHFYAKTNGVKFYHLFILVIFINILGFGFSFFQFLKNPTELTTFSSRAMYLLYLYEHLSNNFYFGIGFDHFKSSIHALSDSKGYLNFSHNPHNVFIKFFSELGVVGGLLFCLALFKACHIKVGYEKDKNIIIVSYAIYLILVQLSFHNFHYMADLYIYIGILIGLQRTNVFKYALK